jgi:tetratricopeptide (TPR) repeat protein
MHLLLASVVGLAFAGFGQTNPVASLSFAASSPDPASRAKLAFEQAQSRFHKEPRDTDAGWQFARATFDLAEFATNSTQRASLGEMGITACRQMLTNAPSSAPLHYYLAMNLGQVARTKGLGALKLVDQMEREFLAARKLDVTFDYAGPDRNLGLLYRDAPALGSVGSRSRARQHLTRAVVLAPEYPENRLDLMESYLEWKDHKDALREFKALEEQWPAARSRFTGEAWTAAWADWEARLQTARKKIEEPSRSAKAPRKTD